MDRLIIGVVIAAVAIVIAVVTDRRRRTQAPSGVTHQAPAQLDRSDFDAGAAAAPWLIVLFSSSSCSSCATARRDVIALASATVAVFEASEETNRSLHQRYRVTGLPTVVIVDEDGVTRASWLGPPPAGEVAARLGELAGC